MKRIFFVLMLFASSNSFAQKKAVAPVTTQNMTDVARSLIADSMNTMRSNVSIAYVTPQNVPNIARSIVSDSMSVMRSTVSNAYATPQNALNAAKASIRDSMTIMRASVAYTFDTITNLSNAIKKGLLTQGSVLDSFIVIDPTTKTYKRVTLAFLSDYVKYTQPQYIRSTSDFSTTATSLQNVSGISASLAANKKYKLTFIGYAKSSVVANGYSYNVQYSGTLAESTGFNDSHAASAKNAFSFNSTTTTPSVSSANNYYGITTDVIFRTNTAGTIQLQFASTSGLSTATLQAGAVLVVQLLD